MDRGAQHILQLLEEGEEEEAQQLMSTRSWGEEELEGLEEEGEVERCHISIVSSRKHIL
jgi:hypothetical protein